MQSKWFFITFSYCNFRKDTFLSATICTRQICKISSNYFCEKSPFRFLLLEMAFVVYTTAHKPDRAHYCNSAKEYVGLSVPAVTYKINSGRGRLPGLSIERPRPLAVLGHLVYADASIAPTDGLIAQKEWLMHPRITTLFESISLIVSCALPPCSSGEQSGTS